MNESVSANEAAFPAAWSDPPAWEVQWGDSPLVATAIHDGAAVRTEITPLLALGQEERLREEDPYTAGWTGVAANRVVVFRSRFEVDLNRPRDQAVYLTPEDAWGLHVWKERPSPEVVGRSLAVYDAFYDQMRHLLDGLVARHGRVVVFDLHSYNHRRQGPDGPPDDPELNPDVNLGTGTMDRQRWAPMVDRFLGELASYDLLGRRLDVRENVRFRGGQLAKWAHETFPETVCVLAIEFKKFFMDEWSGESDVRQIHAIGGALHVAASGVLEELARA